MNKFNELDYLHRWNGDYFGRIDDGEIFTHDGRHVGRLRRHEIYSSKGKYLGEIKSNRLITNSEKLHTKTALGFVPGMRVAGTRVKPRPDPDLELPVGYQDFPAPEEL